MYTTFDKILELIRQYHNKVDGFIPLHEPRFNGNERKYVLDAIDSTFVSSVGKYVNDFESMLCAYTGSRYAVATVNGTAALHMALLIVGVKKDELVITQPLSFIATCNAISYIGADPLFIDVDRDSLGMSPQALRFFLNANAEKKADGFAYNKTSGKKMSACVPMHTFGLPLRIDEIAAICEEWNIPLVEDAAESLGSYYKGIHTGNFGTIGTFSFNGNKTITSGGGGALITNDEALAKRAKHLTTQAKVSHRWRFIHDEIGYNYRMPNLNAALLCAQMEQLDVFVENKRELANNYKNYFQDTDIQFVKEIEYGKANYWLNAILLNDAQERDEFLRVTNDNGVMTRPVWDLMNTLSMFKDCQCDELVNSQWIAERLVNIPSSVRID